jgi:hypothetical protein
MTNLKTLDAQVKTRANSIIDSGVQVVRQASFRRTTSMPASALADHRIIEMDDEDTGLNSVSNENFQPLPTTRAIVERAPLLSKSLASVKTVATTSTAASEPDFQQQLKEAVLARSMRRSKKPEEKKTAASPPSPSNAPPAPPPPPL